MRTHSFVTRFSCFPAPVCAMVTLVTLFGLAAARPARCGEIHDAARDGDLAKVQALLKADPNLVSSRDNNGNTPLHWAAARGHKDVAELLVANKADVNAKNNTRSTPLHSAVYGDSKGVVELLLASHAEVNAQDSDGWTPLHLAQVAGSKEVAELLRRHGGQDEQATAQTPVSSLPANAKLPAATAPSLPAAGLHLMDMKNNEGQTVAELFLTGKEMSFDGQQRLTRGAGYMKATPGQHFNLIALLKSSKDKYIEAELKITLIQWDDSGTTLAVDGLEPTLECDEGVSFKIIGKPSLKDGLITLRLTGGREFSLRPRFWWAAVAVGDVDFIFRASGAPSVPASKPSAGWTSEVMKKQLIAYLSETNSHPGSDLYVIALDGSNKKLLSDGKQDVHLPRWSPDGKSIAFAVYRKDTSALYRVNADGTGLLLVAECNGSGVFPVWSPNSTHIAYAVRRDGKEEIHVVRADGREDRKLTEPADYLPQAWSPDGAWIVYEKLTDRKWQVGFMKPDGTEPRFLPLADSNATNGPIWSADSKKILFNSEKGGKRAVYLFDIRTSDLKRLTDPSDDNFSAAFAPADKGICFASERDGRLELYAMQNDGSNQRPILERGAPNLNFSFSPDGEFIAYDSKREGNFQICVVGIDGRDLHQLTHDDATNTDPQWQPQRQPLGNGAAHPRAEHPQSPRR